MKDPAADWGEKVFLPKSRRIMFRLKAPFNQFQTDYIHQRMKRLDYDQHPLTSGGYVLAFWRPLSDQELTTLMLLLADVITDILYPENANEPETD